MEDAAVECSSSAISEWHTFEERRQCARKASRPDGGAEPRREVERKVPASSVAQHSSARVSNKCQETIKKLIAEEGKVNLLRELETADSAGVWNKEVVEYLRKTIIGFASNEGIAELMVPKTVGNETATPHDDSSKATSQETDRVMSPLEFATKAIDIAMAESEKNSESQNKKESQNDSTLWEDFALMIFLEQKKGCLVLIGDEMTGPEMKKKLMSFFEQNSRFDVEKIKLCWGKKIDSFKSFELVKLQAFFDVLEGDLAALQEFLSSLIVPLRRDDGILEPKLSYVEYSPKEDLFATKQGDKDCTLVVYGESGSGKSVFSCLLAKEHGYLPVYCVVEPEDLRGKSSASDDKPVHQYPLLDAFLRLLINFYVDKEKTVEILCSIKEKIDKPRNQWATEVLERVLSRVLCPNDQASYWRKGKWKSTKPDRVALIIDEATDIDLAEGLVAIGRAKRKEYLERMANHRFAIILVGTGLEAIRYGDRLGTNPEHSKLVRMKSPDIQNILNANMISDEIRYGVENGLFSQIMKSNARMFFRGILPILQLPMHRVDGVSTDAERSDRLKERLASVASFRQLMDYGARFYVGQNTVGKLTKKSREHLLHQAFVYHMERSIQATCPRTMETELKWRRDCREAALDELHAMTLFNNIEAVPSATIFTKGLVSRQGTSRALKYLACFGLTCELRPSFGSEFEEVTALHYIRYMQVLGYRTRRVALKCAWPLPIRKVVDRKLQFEGLRVELDEQKKKEQFTLDGHLDEKLCVVFTQAGPQAQGPDLFALVVDKHSARLDVIQCKHRKVPCGPEVSAGWWSSLGIDVNTKGSQPTTGCVTNAAWSSAGIDAFRTLLTEKIKESKVVDCDVQLGNRILAMSFPTPGTTSGFSIPDTNGTKVWFREMLEPTISVSGLQEYEGDDSIDPADVGD